MSEIHASELHATDPAASAPAVTPPQTEPAPATPPARPEPPRSRGGGVARFLALLLFIALGAAVGLLWQQQRLLTERIARLPAPPADPTAQLAAMSKQIDGLKDQVATLEKRPAPAAASNAPDLAPLAARLAALEKRVAQAPASNPPPPAPDLGPIEQKLASVAAEASAARGAEADMRGKIADLTSRLSAAEQQAKTAEAQAKQLGTKAADAQRLEQAQVALESGEPLGSLPGAPAALARYASAKPPTEAQLRLAFPQAAAAAIRASAPDTSGESLGARMWLRARGLVTVKQGNNVLLGAPAAEVLGAAQARLDAGDLAGAVKALDALDKPAATAAAMASWRQDAESLLDARAALAKMARS